MSQAAADRRPRRHRRTRVLVGWLVFAVLLVLVAALAWVGVRGVLAADQLRRALPIASSIQTAVLSGDSGTAATEAAELRTRADKAHALTSDPVWAVMAKTPWLGPNLRALGGVSASAASVTDNGLDAITSLAGKIGADSFKPKNGALDVAPLASAAPALAKANAAAQAAEKTAAGVSTHGVIGPLASAVTQYKDKIGEVSTFTDAASRAAALLPGMLGQSGPRSYLVLVLNNAELRSLGGIPGSVVHVTADQGKISLDSQYSGASFGPYDGPITKLADPTNQLFGEITGEYMQDVTLTPRFDQSAQLATAMWQQRFGQTVDGVITLDPVALKYILKATGPVTVGAGTPAQTELTSQNVVKSLLSDVYARFSVPADQDAFFDAASAAIFQKLASGDFEPQAMLGAFAQIGSEHRMNVWSSDAAQRKILAGTTLVGGPPNSAPGEQRFGVYLADGTGSKMDYYLHTQVQTGRLTCSKVGALYVVQVKLTNGLTAADAQKLPEYVTGGGAYGVAIGTIRTQVTTYGSPDVEFGSAFDSKGAAEPVKFVKDGDRSVAQYVVDLKPGQSSTVRLVFNPKKGKSGKIAADVTPQINPVSNSTGRFTCETVLK
ncbi:DUF4012 domain-containing protein [Gryllotalpicola koreensis]|uniref:DUF4012 domain-containing protein n=1 Tax=Gryllotalpicola koreensis TaxID=993086 RepID=UPI0031D060DB